jgi:hypothetical protein
MHGVTLEALIKEAPCSWLGWTVARRDGWWCCSSSRLRDECHRRSGTCSARAVYCRDYDGALEATDPTDSSRAANEIAVRPWARREGDEVVSEPSNPHAPQPDLPKSTSSPSRRARRPARPDASPYRPPSRRSTSTLLSATARPCLAFRQDARFTEVLSRNHTTLEAHLEYAIHRAGGPEERV